MDTNIRWRKVILKEKIYDKNDTHILHNVYIALTNIETGYYLIAPFSDFLNQFKGNKTTSASMAAEVIVRFLNYIHFDINKATYEITFQDGINFLNSLDIQKDTQHTYSSYMTKFLFFLAQKGALKNISVEDFSYTFNRSDKRVLSNCFSGRYAESKKQNAETIHNIKPEYLYTFLKTAMDVVPDIALGVFFQCFGGLRKSEVISLEYTNIGVKTVDGIKTMQITLEDKDLREDISTAFISKCKRNRTQTILPAFDDMLWTLYEKHKKNYKKADCSAVFVNKDGKAMTDASYYKRFMILKNTFIERLKNSDDYDTKCYALYLSSFKWGTHICRGIFSNLVAESTDNIMEIATWRGDRSLSSALSYLTDRKQTEEKVLHSLNELYKKEIK